MRRSHLVVAAVLISCCAYAQTVAPVAQVVTDPLVAIHNALFSSFIPLDQEKNEPHISTLFANVRDNIWLAAGQSPAFRQLLVPFGDLSGFGSTCGIASYLSVRGPISFASLTDAQRNHVLFLLQSCDQNEPRRLAATVRNFYVVKTYGAIQEPLTGVNLNLFAPHAWTAQHLPKLPPSRLRFDPERKEIGSVDGPIDYLIVGSGPAGSVLAHELRKGGKHVLLVERGPFIVPGAMETRNIDGLIDSRTSVDGAIRINNGMAVGGGTLVNVDLCFGPMTPAVQAKINGCRREGRIGPEDFSSDQLAKSYAWVKSAIGTRKLSESEINTNNKMLWRGARNKGLHPKLYDLNTYAPGQSPYPVTDKRSSESQLILEAMLDTHNPLSLLPDADVRRVLFEQSGNEQKAMGVEILTRSPMQYDGVVADPNDLRVPAGQTLTIHAKTVILSAGALGSPTILLRSGVSNDQIGRGVVLHPSMPVIGKFDGVIDALNGTQASVYVDDYLADRGYAFESMSAPPVYAALMSPGSGMHTFDMVKSFRYLAGFGVMLVDSTSPQNRLVLDKNGDPLIYYEISEADKQRFRQGIAEAVRVMFLAGAKEVYLPTTESILGSGPAAELEPVVLTHIEQADVIERKFQLIPNQSLVTSSHMQATDKMGIDPKTSVVGRDFHVWGTKNLYVVDGSIFPTSVGANPMQSIYTFAKIFADRINLEP